MKSQYSGGLEPMRIGNAEKALDLNRILIAGMAFLLFSLLTIWVAGCGDTENSSYESSLHGVVMDQQGQPVAGARVTYAGQEADALTDAQGRWFIDHLSTKARDDSPLTVSIPGYENFVGTISDPGVDEIALKSAGPMSDFIYIDQPVDGSTLEIPQDCSEPKVQITGHLGGPTDIVLLIDASGSMGRAESALGGLTAMDLVRDGLSQALSNFDFGRMRVSVMRFYGGSDLLCALSDDPEQVAQAVDNLTVNQDGTTNYQLGIRAAVEMLNQYGRPEAQKRTVLITDGVPTAYGYPVLVSGQNLETQEQADIDGALDSAFYAAQSDIFVDGLAIGADAATSKLTTLPAIAAITSGNYLPIPDLADLSAFGTIWSLYGQLEVEGANAGGTKMMTLAADGSFFGELSANSANGHSFSVYTGQGQSRVLLDSTQLNYTTATGAGNMELVSCQAQSCIEAVWAIYVQYEGPIGTTIEVTKGPQQAHQLTHVVTDTDRRIFLEVTGHGRALVPHLTFHIDKDNDGQTEEDISIHTSCSIPLGPGMEFGPITLLGYGHGEDREVYDGEMP